MKWTKPVVAMATALLVGISASYWAFNSYVTNIAEELISAILHTESAAIQQGNLLSSITKLQSSVDHSENLAGVAAYDLSSDPLLKNPLILLGTLPDQPIEPNQRQRRIGLFDHVFTHPIENQKLLIFYFKPRFISYTFAFTTALLTVFLLGFALFGRQLESVRANARIHAFQQISEQISHDIKSPLSALNLYSGAMAKKGHPTELLEGVVQRISEILDDLKKKSDLLKSGQSTFRLDRALKQVVDEKRMEYPFHQLLLEGSGDFQTRGIESQFKRAISNLLNNAIEASTTERPIRVLFQPSGQTCTIALVDEGKGIPDDIQSRLFQRGSSFGKSNGNGLGLYHANQVVESMNGKLELKSTLGIGTRVTIQLSNL
ncbi:MAG: sensor histidine kinase [Bdellovibrionales bacterium]